MHNSGVSSRATKVDSLLAIILSEVGNSNSNNNNNHQDGVRRDGRRWKVVSDRAAYYSSRHKHHLRLTRDGGFD